MKRKNILQAVVFLCMMVLLAPAAFGSLVGVNWDTGDLYDVSTSDGSLTVIGNTGVNYIGGLAYNGTLYGVNHVGGGYLYTIDPSTAATGTVGPTGTGAFEGALTFDSSGTLWMAVTGLNLGGGSQYDTNIYTVNTSTGAATLQGTVYDKGDVNGLAFRSDGSLVGIDSFSDTLFSINLTTFATTDIAAFGFGGIGAASGLANMGDTGYMATGTFGGTNSLYEVNLLTGSATLVGSFGSTIDSASGMSGLALTQEVPEPATMLLVGFGFIGIGVARRRLK